MMRILVSAIVGAGLAGCSSIVEGTSQEIVVNTNPPGANCELQREGVVIARVNPTPGATTIQKTKHDITISCGLEGYQDASYFNKSDVAGATVGNIILGGGIGWAIDSASGADNKYESPVNIVLIPAPDQVSVSASPEIEVGTGSVLEAESLRDALENAKRLRDEDLITEDEYQTLRNKIISDFSQ